MNYIKAHAGALLAVLAALCLALSSFTAGAEGLPPIGIETSPVTDIKLYSAPDKCAYFVGEDIDVTGAKLKITHQNGVVEIVDVLRNWCGDIDNLAAGTSTVYVEYPQRGTYSGDSPSFRVTFGEPEVSSIEVTKLPNKTSYYTGEQFEQYGAEVIARYTNGETQDVTANVTFSGYDPDVAGKQLVTVTYESGGKITSTAIEVNVTALGVISCTVMHSPDRTTFIEGEEPDLTGIKIGLGYNDGRTEEITDLSEITYDGYNPAYIGTQQINVYCRGMIATLTLKTIVSAHHVHSPGEFTLREAPTCTEEGLEIAVCTICGDTVEQRTVPATGHTWSEWEILRAATVDEDGERRHVCTVCSEAVCETIPKLKSELKDGIVTLKNKDSSPFDGLYSVTTVNEHPEAVKTTAGDFGPVGPWIDKYGKEYDIITYEIINVSFLCGSSAASLPEGTQCTVKLTESSGNVFALRIPGCDEIFGTAGAGSITFDIDSVTSSGFTAAIVEYIPVSGSDEQDDTPDTDWTGKIGKIMLITAIGAVVISAAAVTVTLIIKKRNSDRLN